MGDKRRRVWIDVRALRKERGWLQRETAEKLGISRAHLSAIENRKRGLSFQTMDAVIRVFDVRYEDMTVQDPEEEA